MHLLVAPNASTFVTLPCSDYGSVNRTLDEVAAEKLVHVPYRGAPQRMFQVPDADVRKVPHDTTAAVEFGRAVVE